MQCSLSSDLTYLCKRQQELTNILSAYRKYRDRSTVEMILDGADELKHLSDREFEAGLEDMLDRIGGTIYNVFYFFIKIFRDICFGITHASSDFLTEMEDKIKNIEETGTGEAVYYDTECDVLRKEVIPKVEKVLPILHGYAADMLESFNDKKKFQKAITEFQKVARTLPGTSFYADDADWEISFGSWTVEGFFKQVDWGNNLEEFCKIARRKLADAKKIIEAPPSVRMTKAIDICNDELARARREGKISEHDAEIFLRMIRSTLYFLWTLNGIYHWYNLNNPVSTMFARRGFKDNIFSTQLKGVQEVISGSRKIRPSNVAAQFEKS